MENSTRDSTTKASSTPPHTSFVLRCWTDTDGGFRARLIDVLTGVGHPVAVLADLPPLIERLLARPQQPAAPGRRAGAEPRHRRDDDDAH